MRLDHLWLSVDYTQNFEAFTVSEQKYPKLKETIASLHINNTYVIPVIESGISINADPSNVAQTTGAQQKVFIQANDGSAAVGS